MADMHLFILDLPAAYFSDDPEEKNAEIYKLWSALADIADCPADGTREWVIHRAVRAIHGTRTSVEHRVIN